MSKFFVIQVLNDQDCDSYSLKLEYKSHGQGLHSFTLSSPVPGMVG